MPSFDIISSADIQEVRNAVDQVKRELGSRYDFKGTKASVELNEFLITVIADDSMRLKAVNEILREKLAKRKVSLKCVEFKDPQSAGGDMLKEEVLVKQGLKDEELKKINKEIKNIKLKVNSQIQGDQVRVTGKKRDDLQSVIAHLKRTMSDLELQFTNFRE